ncbi:MAG TPA: hypothetical protein VFE02_01125 [Candidatus Acidoferrales bacterium]|jgi:hypothetical protein|nr:hypothetical protein [Candidatus Acidoferrales bacterium]
MTNPENKRYQVSQLYARMSELELKALADDAWTLTETGNQALLAELARRGLNFQLATAASAPTIAPSSNLVTVRKFRDVPEALLAKGFLESGGLESFLADETTIRMDWLWSNLLGGIKLCVNREDVEAAVQILNQEIPDSFDFGGAEDFVQPHCPQCSSLDITYEDLNKPATYAAAFLIGLPIQINSRRWNCQTCGYVWQKTEEETSRSS